VEHGAVAPDVDLAVRQLAPALEEAVAGRRLGVVAREVGEDAGHVGLELQVLGRDDGTHAVSEEGDRDVGVVIREVAGDVVDAVEQDGGLRPLASRQRRALRAGAGRCHVGIGAADELEVGILLETRTGELDKLLEHFGVGEAELFRSALHLARVLVAHEGVPLGMQSKALLG
jgi:hypothetical protein